MAWTASPAKPAARVTPESAEADSRSLTFRPLKDGHTSIPLPFHIAAGGRTDRSEYLRVRGPLNIAFGGRRYCLSVPGCRAVGATGARPREPLCLDLAGGVFSHVVAAGLDPDGVVHDTVHDRVGVNSGTESLMPIFLGVLGAEHR